MLGRNSLVQWAYVVLSVRFERCSPKENDVAAVTIVIALALIEYSVFGMLVGKARGTYGVAAPAVSGDPIFERYYRVQQNTLEMLVLFIPGIFMFGHYVSADVAVGLGLIFVVGESMLLIQNLELWGLS